MAEIFTTVTDTAASPRVDDLVTDLSHVVGVLRRSWLVIALAVLCHLTIAVVYLSATKRVYQSEARLLVLQQGGGRPLNMSNADPGRAMEGNDDYVPTHALIIGSPMVVKQAIESVGLAALPTLQAVQAAGGDPVEVAVANLRVTRPDKAAKILLITYKTGDNAEAARMVTAIVSSYDQFLEHTFQKSSNSVIAMIGKARDELDIELKSMEEQYLQMRQKSSVLLLGGEEARTFVASRLSQWDRAANDAVIKAAQLKAQLELGKKLAKRGAEMWAIAHALSLLGGESASLNGVLLPGGGQGSASEYVHKLSLDQQQLANRYGPENVKVRELQSQINLVRKRLVDSRGRADGGDTGALIESIEEALASVRMMRDDLLAQFEKDQQAAKNVEVDLLTEQNLRGKLERQRALFLSVVEQLKQAQFVQDYSSITSHVVEPAKVPRTAVWPKAYLVLALATAVGAVVGLGAVLVLDRLDQRIRSADDLRRVVSLPVLGRVPRFTEEHPGRVKNFGLICHDQPRSAWAESYRAIRTNIDFLRRSRPIQVVMVASPHSGDGKSSTASNLAICFALSGRKVLLIDADLRKPSQNNIHGVDLGDGLSARLRDGLPLGQAVRPTAVVRLDILTAGCDTGAPGAGESYSPAELLSSDRLAELIDEARGAYENVVIDSSPLLAVTDPMIIGSLVDGVILVARVARTTCRDVERTTEMLQNTDTPVLGTILNGVTKLDSSFGYVYGSRRPAEKGMAKSPAPGADDSVAGKSKANNPGNGFRTNGTPV